MSEATNKSERSNQDNSAVEMVDKPSSGKQHIIITGLAGFDKAYNIMNHRPSRF